jgi:hypothetical protein
MIGHTMELDLRVCVCGCGREVPRPANLTALTVMCELMEFDRLRWIMGGAGADLASTDRFIDDGVFVYESLLAFLHGEEPGYARGTDRWLKFARKSRKGLARRTGLVRPGRGPLLPLDEDIKYLNRTAPHLSFTGSPNARAEAARIRAEVDSDHDLALLTADLDETESDPEPSESEGATFECPTCGVQFDDMVALGHHEDTAH